MSYVCVLDHAGREQGGPAPAGGSEHARVRHPAQASLHRVAHSRPAGGAHDPQSTALGPGGVTHFNSSALTPPGLRPSPGSTNCRLTTPRRPPTQPLTSPRKRGRSTCAGTWGSGRAKGRAQGAGKGTAKANAAGLSSTRWPSTAGGSGWPIETKTAPSRSKVCIHSAQLSTQHTAHSTTQSHSTSRSTQPHSTRYTAQSHSTSRAGHTARDATVWCAAVVRRPSWRPAICVCVRSRSLPLPLSCCCVRSVRGDAGGQAAGVRACTGVFLLRFHGVLSPPSAASPRRFLYCWLTNEGLRRFAVRSRPSMQVRQHTPRCCW